MKFGSIYKIILGTIITANLASCSRGDPAPRDLIRIDIGQEVATLDPSLTEDVSSTRVLTDLFAGLVDYDQKNNVIPGMAEKWEISNDGKTYTFHLRKNLKFSDGSPITAKDFVWSWQRLVNPKTASDYNFILSNVVNGQEIIDGKKPPSTLGVSAKDSYTFIVHLTQPDNNFLQKNTLPNLYVLPQKTIEKYGAKWTNPQNIVTSGAYTLKEHVVNGHIMISRNPNYYDADKVDVPNIEFFPFVDANASLNAYKTENLDITFQTVPIDQIPSVTKDFGNQLYNVKQEAIGYYEFNMQDPELGKNLKLRQALSMAIDRNALTRDVLQDGKVPLYSAITPTVDNAKYASIKYAWANLPDNKRIAEARKLYAEAGYGPNHPYKVKISYNTNDMYKTISLSLAAMWKDTLGVEATVENQDWKTFLQTRHRGNYQIARGRWYADYNGITSYTPLYQCNSSTNDSHYCYSPYDDLVSQAEKSLDAKVQTADYTKAFQIIQDQYVIIPLFQFTFMRLVSTRIKNYEIKDNYMDRPQSKWFKL